MTKWYSISKSSFRLDLDSSFYLMLYFDEGYYVEFRICINDKPGDETIYYQDLTNTREGQHFKEAEDLAKRYFASITSGL